MRLGINGRFYRAQVTGVQRFAIEITRRLTTQADVVLFLPADAPEVAVPAKEQLRGHMRGHAWEQFELPGMMARAQCDTVLHMAGTAPLRCSGDVIMIHDVLPLTHPQWFSSSFRIWRRAVLERAVPRAAHVLTASEWSRREIMRSLHVPDARISLVTQGLEP